MPTPANSSLRLVFWPKRLVYAGYLVLFAALAQSFELTRGTIALFALPIVLSELLVRPLVAARLRVFDKAVLAGLSSGAGESLLTRYQDERLLRFAAPKYQLLPKLGLIYEHLGQPALAAQAFRIALEEAPPKKAIAIACGLGDSLVASGEYREAERVYRAILKADGALTAAAYANFAEAVHRLHADFDEPETLLRHALSLDAANAKIVGQLVALLRKKGDLDKAREELERARAVLTDEELSSIGVSI